jgi:hypothetical protein
MFAVISIYAGMKSIETPPEVHVQWVKDFNDAEVTGLA